MGGGVRRRIRSHADLFASRARTAQVAGRGMAGGGGAPRPRRRPRSGARRTRSVGNGNHAGGVCRRATAAEDVKPMDLLATSLIRPGGARLRALTCALALVAMPLH